MSPSSFPPAGASAPDLTGPVSILNWPVAGPRSVRRHRQRSFTHVHLEIDLRPSALGKGGSSVVRRIEKALREREVEEGSDLLRLTGAVLHGFSAVGFLRIFHWESVPGGWLPLPNGASAPASETPLGQFLRALASPAWKNIAAARSFSMRLGAKGNLHADVVIRRVHRERRHSISLDLRGLFPEPTVRDVVGALHERVPLRTATVTIVAYQGA